LVGRAGIEPAQSCLQGSLSPSRLPVPPPAHGPERSREWNEKQLINREKQRDSQCLFVFLDAPHEFFKVSSLFFHLVALIFWYVFCCIAK
jgi:hypothetical protein